MSQLTGRVEMLGHSPNSVTGKGESRTGPYEFLLGGAAGGREECDITVMSPLLPGLSLHSQGF